MSVSKYRELDVWKAARVLARNIYNTTRTYPTDERFGIVSQMRRAAISILSNIAEASGRWSTADQKHFYVIARGSALELEAQLVISEDLQFISSEIAAELNADTVRVAQMLNGLMRFLKKS